MERDAPSARRRAGHSNRPTVAAQTLLLPQLAELIVAGGADDPLRSDRRDVTVVFLDPRGFTRFAEGVAPEPLMAMLREFHAAMGRLIIDYEGTLERFTGDGMMIFSTTWCSSRTRSSVRLHGAGDEREVRALCARWREVEVELIGDRHRRGPAILARSSSRGAWITEPSVT